ncbi:MAG TPA: hypothetical protein VM846_02835, partial [Vicinamibacterales bacterium]|nr:hypothetical protein [Vicinamibacterales bacterium]
GDNVAMYDLLLVVHSWLRWAVLILGLVAFARSAASRFTRRPWTPADETVGKWFVISVDLQVLVGLLLYFFFSSFTMSAWRDMAGAMADPIIRFWSVEHMVGMLAATAFVHVGRVRIRKAKDASRKHFLAAIFFGLALVLMLASIPWPFGSIDRPYLRGL